MPIFITVAVAFLVGLAVVIHKWQWIVDLPAGGGAFLGTLVGASIGLSAIILGALYNAEKNRDRDDRLRTIERRALLEALLAELELFGNMLLANAKRATSQREDLRDQPPATMARVRELLRFPQPKIYEANLARLGLIGGRLTGTMAHAYSVVADTGAFIANIPDKHVWDALSGIGKKCRGNRRFIVKSQRLLMEEIKALGGLTGTHVSDETAAAISAEVDAEFASEEEHHAGAHDKSTRAEQRGAGLAL